MNVIGQVVAWAEAEVIRAPQNAWMDEDDSKNEDNKKGSLS